MMGNCLFYVACHEVGVAHCFMDGGCVHTYGRVVRLYNFFYLLQYSDSLVLLAHFRQQQSVVDDLRDAVMTGE